MRMEVIVHHNRFVSNRLPINQGIATFEALIDTVMTVEVSANPLRALVKDAIDKVGRPITFYS